MTHNSIWKAIERIAEKNNLSCSGLAKKSGLNSTTFNPSKRWSKEGQERWPSSQSISKILRATDYSIQDFADIVTLKKEKEAAILGEKQVS